MILERRTDRLKLKKSVRKIGVSGQDREEIAGELSDILANTYVLYLMSQNFHWNVRGRLFSSLHKFFEEEYTELAKAVDRIAERIRALGFLVPATLADFLKNTSLGEKPGTLSADEMIQALIDSHETVIRALRDAFSLAEGVEDDASCDLISQRLEAHEKSVWMLRSSLAEV
ncbi:MAG: DNA starvation/stationary phase protection protein [Candidatus Omnitrophica bacterium]|nr:DNA starvation/stationary phase protection protein [Candidatus Omnitrophota bacterium]